MDWIEKIFHISPDGGNGVTELLVQAGVLATIVLVSIRVTVRRLRRRREHGPRDRQI